MWGEPWRPPCLWHRSFPVRLLRCRSWFCEMQSIATALMTLQPGIQTALARQLLTHPRGWMPVTKMTYVNVYIITVSAMIVAIE